MSRFHSYLSTAAKIVTTYKSGSPLLHHLKDFFSREKKYGSTDRKQISSLCYQYFRLASAWAPSYSLEEKILLSAFLCEKKSTAFLACCRPDLNEHAGMDLKEKIRFLSVSIEKIFPFEDLISKSVSKELFNLSFLNQPSVFVRIRPGKKEVVSKKLADASIAFEWKGDHCIAVSPRTQIEEKLKLNKEAVIQDYNSQKVFDYFSQSANLFSAAGAITAWDCCAASGGKSILLYDMLQQKVKISVSDIRKTSLQNLKQRFQQAAIPIQQLIVNNMAVSSGFDLAEQFTIVICDVPCSGSGTWSRTPEMKAGFEAQLLQSFIKKQQSIVSAAFPHVEKNGFLVYITCSVFEKENEGMVDYIKEKFGVSPVQMHYLKGYEIGADTMFVAIFKVI